ncbi:MAG: hypothetical protein LAN84_12580 [Acidobacteriia bacterium]|nr:hypothetical protein [Terriglobia bacterium]
MESKTGGAARFSRSRGLGAAIVLLAAGMAAGGPSLAAKEKKTVNAPSISVARARIQVQLALRRTYRGERWVGGLFSLPKHVAPVTNIRVAEDGLYFTTTATTERGKNEKNAGGDEVAKFTALKNLSVVQEYNRVREHRVLFTVASREAHKAGVSFEWLLWERKDDAEEFASGMNRLIEAAEKGETVALESDAVFKAHAEAWRRMATKPAHPEEIERAWVLAEDAIKEKHFGSAAAYYDEGLEKFDMWPEGYYNAAMVFAEIKLYGEACAHMKRYLEMVPEAPDAKAARENVYIWEEKAKTDTSGDPTVTSGAPNAAEKY